MGIMAIMNEYHHEMDEDSAEDPIQAQSDLSDICLGLLQWDLSPLGSMPHCCIVDYALELQKRCIKIIDMVRKRM